ncbi:MULTISPECIES: membrane protein insertase YidC [unclassified Gemella]|uniref:YidC/Oxa1 family membrane protein insertase n=1 Tax=unclassified Gemella TaxID=2624949 RepID=UPI001D164CE8|nr:MULTISPECIES: membrane protein insertase YidC [unclassified Gemella]
MKKKISVLTLFLLTTITLTGCSAEDREGWFYETFVKPMDLFLKWIYDLVGNWGLAIILITVVVRFIVMPFMLYNTKKQRDAKIGMEKARPELTVVQEKMSELKKEEVRAITNEDRMRIRTAQMELQKEQMAIMRKHNAMPFSVGGCLPILLQMPVMTGLYFTLLNPYYSDGIKEATFLGIFNLGSRSYILPIIAFIVYAIQIQLTMKLNPQPIQPGQEAMANQMKAMQWISPVMIAGFSFIVAGAVGLYYIIGGLFLIIQIYIGYLLFPPYIPEKQSSKENNFDESKVTLVSNKKNKRR